MGSTWCETKVHRRHREAHTSWGAGLSDPNGGPLPSTNSHPNSFNNDTPKMPIASSRDVDEEAKCPVCLKTFSFFLRVNNPHLISPRPVSPQFTVPYRVLPGLEWSGNPALGFCGVCRRPMKAGDGDSGKLGSEFPLPHTRLNIFFLLTGRCRACHVD